MSSSSASAKAIAVSNSLDSIIRKSWGKMMAALTSQLNSIQLAEDALQESCISALVHWGQNGLPNSPEGWLIRVAYRKALNQIRSDKKSYEREKIATSIRSILENEEPDEIPDERLRLIFTCCHPALDIKSRVSLTLRSICGLTTLEIAHLFLDTESTMAQRLSRAKAKITKEGITISIPEADKWDERLHSVLTTIYLVFTTGYTNFSQSKRDLCNEAIYLTQLLLSLCPNQAEVEGALSLMLLTDSRRKARINTSGESVPPGDQDRYLWDHTKLDKGKQILEQALNRKKAGPFQIKAAISACQMTDSKPDWKQILELYTVLYAMEPTSIVRLNQIVALAESGNPSLARSLIWELEADLKEYQPFYAGLARILYLVGDKVGSAKAYNRAIELATNPSDRLYLLNRLKLVDAKSD